MVVIHSTAVLLLPLSFYMSFSDWKLFQTFYFYRKKLFQWIWCYKIWHFHSADAPCNLASYIFFHSSLSLIRWLLIICRVVRADKNISWSYNNKNEWQGRVTDKLVRNSSSSWDTTCIVWLSCHLVYWSVSVSIIQWFYVVRYDFICKSSLSHDLVKNI